MGLCVSKDLHGISDVAHTIGLTNWHTAIAQPPRREQTTHTQTDFGTQVVHHHCCHRHQQRQATAISHHHRSHVLHCQQILELVTVFCQIFLFFCLNVLHMYEGVNLCAIFPWAKKSFYKEITTLIWGLGEDGRKQINWLAEKILLPGILF